MYIAKIPGHFELPKYQVPVELESALKKGLENVNSDSNPDSWVVSYLKRLIKKDAVPEKDLAKCYTILLSVEQHFENEEIKKRKLLAQSPVYGVSEKSFKISVPDLNEDDPFISPGDFVCLHDNVSKTKHVLFIVDIWNGYLTAEPRNNKKGAKKSSVAWFSENRKYDVTFELSHYPTRCARFANEKIDRWKFKNEILNPVKSLKNRTRHDINVWFNPNISNNKEQKKAIVDIVNKTAFPAPYILFGPPGTGKTATIVETILQIYCRDGKKKVLVCTPANTPADDITKLLLQKHVPSADILRLNSASRENKLEDEDVIRCSNVYFEGRFDGKRLIMPMEEIMTKRIIICTLTTALKLLGLGLDCSYFSHIFIDEAAQASEPETWIPISLLVAKSPTSTQVVLSGDIKQLGPVVKSELINHLLGVSMMERLMTLDCYKNIGEKQFYVTKLIKNFRCHSSILKVPNELFYDGELQSCGGPEILQGVNWKYLPNKKVPIIFHAVLGYEEKSEKSHSPFNSAEINVCLEYVKRLTKSGKFQDKSIGIITPFKKQEMFIKNRLKNLGISDIEVGTVQTFQGLEKDAIIMSTVRSKLLQHKGKKHIGFLSDDKRFNVSITRAKSLLIVIGNPNILQYDGTWSKFIQHCLNNKAYTEDKIGPQTTRRIASTKPAKVVRKRRRNSKSKQIVQTSLSNPPRSSTIIPVGMLPSCGQFLNPPNMSEYSNGCSGLDYKTWLLLGAGANISPPPPIRELWDEPIPVADFSPYQYTARQVKANPKSETISRSALPTPPRSSTVISDVFPFVQESIRPLKVEPAVCSTGRIETRSQFLNPQNTIARSALSNSSQSSGDSSCVSQIVQKSSRPLKDPGACSSKSNKTILPTPLPHVRQTLCGYVPPRRSEPSRQSYFLETEVESDDYDKEFDSVYSFDEDSQQNPIRLRRQTPPMWLRDTTRVSPVSRQNLKKIEESSFLALVAKIIILFIIFYILVVIFSVYLRKIGFQ